MKLDIQTGVQTAFLLTLLLGLLSLLLGIRSIQAGNRLQYFRKRRDRIVAGWRMIFVAFCFGTASLIVNRFAEPVIYNVYPPSPTVTLTPTVTITPSISPTPTITITPTITNTPSVTNTPSMPQEVETQFQSTITPKPDAVFSALRFGLTLDLKTFELGNEGTEFANPISKIFGIFSYDGMTPGAQWTALWYRNGELVFYDTMPWDGGTGGYGYTEWAPENSEEWQPGTYEVQIFVGNQWINGASGTFTVTGTPPTPLPTKPPTPTRTPTPTIGPSPTRTSTATLTPSNTPTITLTPTVTKTPTITMTPTITRTPRPTDTRWFTLTTQGK